MWKTITLNLMFQRNQKRLGEGWKVKNNKTKNS